MEAAASALGNGMGGKGLFVWKGVAYFRNSASSSALLSSSCIARQWITLRVCQKAHLLRFAHKILEYRKSKLSITLQSPEQALDLRPSLQTFDESLEIFEVELPALLRISRVEPPLKNSIIRGYVQPPAHPLDFLEVEGMISREIRSLPVVSLPKRLSSLHIAQASHKLCSNGIQLLEGFVPHCEMVFGHCVQMQCLVFSIGEGNDRKPTPFQFLTDFESFSVLSPILASINFSIVLHHHLSH